MKSINNPGIIYDCIVCGIIHFNPSAKACLNSQIDIRDLEIRPSKHLYPFFFYKNEPCVLTEYLLQHIEAVQKDFDSFLDILSRKEDLKVFIIQYYFKQWKQQPFNSDDLVSQIEKLPLEERLKTHLVILFYQFDKVHSELLLFFRESYPLLYQMHIQHIDKKAETMNKLEQPEHRNIFCKFHALQERELTQMILSVSLLNPNLCLLQQHGQFQFCLLGSEFDKWLKEGYSYQHITPASFFRILGIPACFDMIQYMLRRKEPVTLTHLAKELHLSHSTIRRHVEVMLIEMLILITERNGKGVYLSINYEYFKSLKPTLLLYLNELISASGEEDGDEEESME